MPWYFFLLEFFAGAFLANGVPHFVQGISGAPFQSPFGKPPGVGESSPLSNVLWGFGNLVAGVLLLHFFLPWGHEAAAGWIVVGLGMLVMAIQLATHFGKVRAAKA
ncbi:MAG TPA: hypothetical protein VHY48_04865 [Acidobacteriaceae bacterium]|jgi:hypothetical protein|nr:hypothetical protein [Acidobacteriaceae bacterium]